MESYRFMEVSMACSSIEEQEKFWIEMFGGQVLFRGKMAGHPFSRMIACGVTLVFREDPEFPAKPGPGQEFHFREHLGLRVDDLDKAIADLESRGAHFVLTPAIVRQMQQKKLEGAESGRKWLETDFIAPPLTRERIDSGEYKHEVAIMVGPDNLWIELNEVKEPEDARWFPE
jgi:hypothetical protein